MRWPAWFRFHPCHWWAVRHSVREQERQAAAELDESKRLLAEDRQQYVYPLVTEHQRNRFSDMIRDALEGGYGGSQQPGYRERKKQ